MIGVMLTMCHPRKLFNGSNRGEIIFPDVNGIRVLQLETTTFSCLNSHFIIQAVNKQKIKQLIFSFCLEYFFYSISFFKTDLVIYLEHVFAVLETKSVWVFA